MRDTDLISVAGLNDLLAALNRARAEGAAASEDAALERCVELLFAPSRRLAVYGSLAPDRENHGVLADIAGDWVEGHVRGRLRRTGWGSELGYPALTWEPDGDEVGVWVLVAEELQRRWPELDRFEGPGYLRGLAPVFVGERLFCVANIYLAV